MEFIKIKSRDNEMLFFLKGIIKKKSTLISSFINHDDKEFYIPFSSDRIKKYFIYDVEDLELYNYLNI